MSLASPNDLCAFALIALGELPLAFLITCCNAAIAPLASVFSNTFGASRNLELDFKNNELQERLGLVRRCKTCSDGRTSDNTMYDGDGIATWPRCEKEFIAEEIESHGCLASVKQIHVVYFFD